MTRIELSIDGLVPANRRLNALTLTGVKQRRELTKLCRKVISYSKKRVSKQTDLSGASYKKRHKPRSDRGKMLVRLYRRLKVMRNDGNHADISFPGFAAQIAAKHQFGASETMSAAQLQNSGSARSGQATKQQAQALRNLGYKSKGRKASLASIQSTLSMGQAGAIIRAERIKQGQQKRSSWTTTLSPRSALGATDSEITELATILMNDVTEDI